MKQVFFLHSAGPQGKHEGSYDFVSWLKDKLGSAYIVHHPVMPRPENPEYEPWKRELHKSLAKIHGDIILVGHSLGGSVLLKYLTEESIPANIKGMFLCATPFWGADDDWQHEPFTLPDNFAEQLPNIPVLYFYHSQNDQTVPIEHLAQYQKSLPTAAINVIDGDSHAFSEGIQQLVRDIEAIDR